MSDSLTVNKLIEIQTPVSKVWKALTDAALIKQYFFGTHVISEWKEGTPIYFTGAWNGTDYKDKGMILKLEKEKIFQYTYWSNFSGLPDVPENYSVVTYQLSSLNDTATLLHLTQDHFPNASMIEHSDKGWDGVLKLLKELLEK